VAKKAKFDPISSIPRLHLTTFAILSSHFFLLKGHYQAIHFDLPLNRINAVKTNEHCPRRELHSKNPPAIKVKMVKVKKRNTLSRCSILPFYVDSLPFACLLILPPDTHTNTYTHEYNDARVRFETRRRETETMTSMQIYVYQVTFVCPFH